LKLLELILENKDWLFSGAGVVVATFVISKIVSSKKKKSNNSSLANLYKMVPGFILKRRFPEQRLTSFVTIDIRSRGESVRLNLGELPDCQAWLYFVNHSPFDIEIESIKAVLNYNGCCIDLENKDHVDVKSHSTNDLIYLQGKLTGEQAVHCSREVEHLNVSLSLNLKIRTSFGVFKKYSGDLQTFNVSIINRRKNQA